MSRPPYGTKSRRLAVRSLRRRRPRYLRGPLGASGELALLRRHPPDRERPFLQLPLNTFQLDHASLGSAFCVDTHTSRLAGTPERPSGRCGLYRARTGLARPAEPVGATFRPFNHPVCHFVADCSRGDRQSSGRRSNGPIDVARTRPTQCDARSENFPVPRSERGTLFAVPVSSVLFSLSG